MVVEVTWGAFWMTILLFTVFLLAQALGLVIADEVKERRQRRRLA